MQARISLMIGSDCIPAWRKKVHRRREGHLELADAASALLGALGQWRLRGRLVFDSTKEDLIDFLREIDSGKIQLPE